MCRNPRLWMGSVWPSIAAPILAFTLSACSPSAAPPSFQGYVEGNAVNLAAEEAGKIAAVLVKRGQRVSAGDVLFRLNDAEQTAMVNEAKARFAQAEAQLANLRTGKRAEEVAVIEAQLTQARTSLNAAEKDLSRASELFASKVVPQSQMDAARERRDVAAAQVAASERSIEAARLAARPDEILAAERNRTAIAASLEAAQLRLARRTITASVGGTIEEVYFDAGEFAALAQPVVSILPDNGRKIRFYLPEPKLSEIRQGERVALACDGCAADLQAEVTFIAAKPEFTPPVIYSKENRAKLVFRVEARPLGDANALTIGVPVDVRSLPSGRAAGQP